MTIEQPHRFPPALGARLGLNGSVDGGPSFVAARQVAVAVTDALPAARLGFRSDASYLNRYSWRVLCVGR